MGDAVNVKNPSLQWRLRDKQNRICLYSNPSNYILNTGYKDQIGDSQTGLPGWNHHVRPAKLNAIDMQKHGSEICEYHITGKQKLFSEFYIQ